MRNKIKSLFVSSMSEKNITAMKIAYELYNKEQIIYKKTKQFINQSKTKVSLDYLFYDFQILCEFIKRFYKDLSIEIIEENLDSTLELLWLANRFLQIGHYDAAWWYLRKAFESWLSCFHWWTPTNNFKDKVIWLIHNRKYASETLFLDEKEVYKIYQYLSNMYIHKTDISSNILFDENKYNQISWTMIVVIIVMSYLVIDMVDENILIKYQQKELLNPVDDYKFYVAYIWPLVWSASVSSSKSWFLHGIEYSWIQEYNFKKDWMGLDLSKRIR